MPALPTPGQSEDTWGDELNDFLEVGHNADGTLNPDAITSGTIAAARLPNSVILLDAGSSETVNKIWVGSEAQYDAIVTKDESTLYFVT